MAYIYCLAARCPTGVASRLAQKYAGQTFVFSDVGGICEGGEVCRFYTGYHSTGKEWWLSVTPSGITASGITDEKEAKRANEFCNVIYGMLRNDEGFDYAIAGVEVEEFREWEELKEELANDHESLANMDGLVVSKTLLEAHYKPLYPASNGLFQPFSKTHLWIPKKCEIESFKRKYPNA